MVKKISTEQVKPFGQNLTLYFFKNISNWKYPSTLQINMLVLNLTLFLVSIEQRIVPKYLKKVTKSGQKGNVCLRKGDKKKYSK